jgi:hypothetical protein
MRYALPDIIRTGGNYALISGAVLYVTEYNISGSWNCDFIVSPYGCNMYEYII